MTIAMTTEHNPDYSLYGSKLSPESEQSDIRNRLCRSRISGCLCGLLAKP